MRGFHTQSLLPPVHLALAAEGLPSHRVSLGPACELGGLLWHQHPGWWGGFCASLASASSFSNTTSSPGAGVSQNSLSLGVTCRHKVSLLTAWRLLFSCCPGPVTVGGAMALRSLRRVALAQARWRGQSMSFQAPFFQSWDYLRRFKKTKGPCVGQLQVKSFALLQSDVCRPCVLFSARGACLRQTMEQYCLVLMPGFNNQ